MLEQLMKGLGDLDLTKMLGGMTDMFENEGLTNMLGVGKGIYDSMQAGNMMDFQKDKWNMNEARTAEAHKRATDKDDATLALDF